MSTNIDEIVVNIPPKKKMPCTIIIDKPVEKCQHEFDDLVCHKCGKLMPKPEISEEVLVGWMKEYWKDKGIRKLVNMSLYTNGLAHFLKEKGL